MEQLTTSNVKVQALLLELEELNSIKTDLDVIISSEETFYYENLPKSQLKPLGSYSYNFDDGYHHIRYRNSSPNTIVHESRHSNQALDGYLFSAYNASGYGTILEGYDFMDEYEAFDSKNIYEHYISGTQKRWTSTDVWQRVYKSYLSKSHITPSSTQTCSEEDYFDYTRK